MIFYNPTDGFVRKTPIESAPKECFLMTSLGDTVSPIAEEMRGAIVRGCQQFDYGVVDAASRITGRDFLLKIWVDIAARPLAVGVITADMKMTTQANIFYEMGIAQALGKETVIVKSPQAEVPSDFVRTEYIEYDGAFQRNFSRYMGGLAEQAVHYEKMADSLDRDPILAMDYLKRAYLLTGDELLREQAQTILDGMDVTGRTKDSVENLVAGF